jgi:hypothetical protein
LNGLRIKNKRRTVCTACSRLQQAVARGNSMGTQYDINKLKRGERDLVLGADKKIKRRHLTVTNVVVMFERTLDLFKNSICVLEWKKIVSGVVVEMG